MTENRDTHGFSQQHRFSPAYREIVRPLGSSIRRCHGGDGSNQIALSGGDLRMHLRTLRDGSDEWRWLGVCWGTSPAIGPSAVCKIDPLSSRSVAAALASSRTTAVRKGLLGTDPPVTQPPSTATSEMAADGLPIASALLEIARNVVARFIGATAPIAADVNAPTTRWEASSADREAQKFIHMLQRTMKT